MPTVYLNFFGGITDTNVNKIMLAAGQIVSQQKPEELYFLFASPGGSVDAGIALYNFLRALPTRIVMHNTGAIDSIANVVFHAADTRRAAPHSTFLFHGVGLNLNSNASLKRSQIEELRSQISALEDKIASILSGRCQLTDAEIRNLFLYGEAKDTAFALEKGIIQEVVDPKIPAGAQFHTLNLA